MTFILVHSPSVGPTSWRLVADQLADRGARAVLPDLRAIGHGGPPYWPRVAAAVRAAVPDGAGPVTLVAHSNAGLFLPVIADALPVPVSGAVFVDAALPAVPGPSTVAPPALVSWLRGLADEHDRLPRWTDWWPPAEVAAMLPDPERRAVVIAEQPRLPVDYYLQQVPTPPAWTGVACSYLQFSAGYAEQATAARGAGWPVEVIEGEHLHQVVDAARVTDAILRLAGTMTSNS